MITDSPHQQRLQIEQAAHGMVSGTLKEWPHLIHALRARGVRLDKHASAQQVREVCIALLAGEALSAKP